MTSNQQIMSVLKNAGENRQLNNLNLGLWIFAGLGIAKAFIVIPKYIESQIENKRLRTSNNGMLRDLKEIQMNFADLYNTNLLLKESNDIMNKELITMRNNNKSKSKA